MSADQEAKTLPLPSHAYVPGTTQRHEEGFLDHIIERAPAKTESSSADDNIAWHYGLLLLRENFFWEAHEVLEAVWMRSGQNTRERFLVQAVIHLANARLKSGMGQAGAETRLSKLADEAAERAFTGSANTVMGMSKSQFYAL